MNTATIERIQMLHRHGLSLAAIARRLNKEGIPTPRTGKWHPPGVARALKWEQSA